MGCQTSSAGNFRQSASTVRFNARPWANCGGPLSIGSHRVRTRCGCELVPTPEIRSEWKRGSARRRSTGGVRLDRKIFSYVRVSKEELERQLAQARRLFAAAADPLA